MHGRHSRGLVAFAVVWAMLATALLLTADVEARRRKGHRTMTQVDQQGERNEYNYVADPSFENEISEWENESDADGGTGNQWVISHDGAWSRSGEGYAFRGGAGFSARKLWNLRVFDVVPEQLFHLEAFIITSAGIEVGVRWYDEAGVTISDNQTNIAVAGRKVLRVMPPANAVKGQVFLNQDYPTGTPPPTTRVDDVFAAQFPSHLAPLAETSPVATDTDSSTRTNAAYGDLADTANSPAVDFIAPPNGRVEVEVSAYMKSGTAGDKSCMGYQIIDNTDSSVFQDAADARSACTSSGSNLTLTRSAEVAGLVPGRSYKARAKYKSAGTITADARRISVRPQLGVL